MFGWLHLADVGFIERLPILILYRFPGNGEIGAENWPIQREIGGRRVSVEWKLLPFTNDRVPDSSLDTIQNFNQRVLIKTALQNTGAFL